LPKLRHTDWPDRLWIVRHGQSAGNVARDAAELQGLPLIELATRDADVPLSQLGEQQAAALAHWFASKPASDRPNVFMTSPFVRAQQTCTAVAQATAFEESDVHIDERLREKEFGILDR
jgi:broad specificity phosphatase PhoE